MVCRMEFVVWLGLNLVFLVKNEIREDQFSVKFFLSEIYDFQ